MEIKISGSNFAILEDGVVRISEPLGASYNGIGAATGVVKVLLPVSARDVATFIKFTLTVQNNATDGLRIYEVGGLKDASNLWSNTTAIFLDDVSSGHTVRFGDDGTTSVVTVGDTGTAWDNVTATVSNVQATTESLGDWPTGFSLVIENSYPSTVDVVHTDVVAGGNTTITGDLSVTGDILAGTATSAYAQTGRADNLVIGSPTDHSGITVVSSTTTNGALYFSDGTVAANHYAGHILYNHNLEKLILGASATNIMVVTSAGVEVVGTIRNSTAPVNYAQSAAANMAIGDTGGNGGLTIASSATAAGSIHFAKGSAGTDQYRGYLNYVHSTDIMNFGTSGAGRMDLSVTGLNVVGDVKASGAFTRTAYNSGYLEGGYNNIGASSTDTGPIYTIGSAYQPAATTLGIMYGIGYAHTNASFINFTGQSGWGMYVASAGLAKVWLGSDNGVISSTGQHYVGANVVWNAGNDGTGSGLDADLLDGVQGSSYLQSGGSSYTINTPTSAAFGGGSALQIYQPTAGTAAQMVFHVGGDFAGYFGLDGAINDFAIGGWSYGASAKYKVWHAGNDGAGSGLDADLLDGIAGGNFNRGDSVYGSMPGVSGWDMNTVFTTRNRSGFIDAWSGTNFPSGTTHVQGIQVRHNSGNHYGFQLVNQYNQDKIWHRRVTNSSFAGWSQVWTSSTDGAGSGLDADLLDGVQASGFLSSSSAATQNHYIRNGSPTVYFRDTNHRSAMLHVNAEIIYFLSGSAADSNVWSTMSNGRWPMQLNTTTGTMTVGGNVTANSDIRLKENIRPIGNSMAMFDQIDAKRFDWKKGEKVGDLGFIAQDVRAAGLEEVVVESENRDLDTKELIGTTLTLDYSRMVSVLWDVVKELKTEIEDLKIQIGE